MASAVGAFATIDCSSSIRGPAPRAVEGRSLGGAASGCALAVVTRSADMDGDLPFPSGHLPRADLAELAILHPGRTFRQRRAGLTGGRRRPSDRGSAAERMQVVDRPSPAPG